MEPESPNSRLREFLPFSPDADTGDEPDPASYLAVSVRESTLRGTDPKQPNRPNMVIQKTNMEGTEPYPTVPRQSTQGS